MFFDFTLRALQAESRFSEMSSNYDSALSARLELEAKVESASDERRSLLERCLGAESELERSRSVVVELRRKLDDSQAALHELGRENQSIQVSKFEKLKLNRHKNKSI
jgi:early endosome antigen 1